MLLDEIKINELSMRRLAMFLVRRCSQRVVTGFIAYMSNHVCFDSVFYRRAYNRCSWVSRTCQRAPIKSDKVAQRSDSVPLLALLNLPGALSVPSRIGSPPSIPFHTSLYSYESGGAKQETRGESPSGKLDGPCLA